MPNNMFDYMRPDFEADMQLPEWHQMAEQGQPLNISPFVDALKKRMNKPADSGNLGAAAGNVLAPKSNRGMQSL